MPQQNSDCPRFFCSNQAAAIGILAPWALNVLRPRNEFPASPQANVTLPAPTSRLDLGPLPDAPREMLGALDCRRNSAELR